MIYEKTYVKTNMIPEQRGCVGLELRFDSQACDWRERVESIKRFDFQKFSKMLALILLLVATTAAFHEELIINSPSHIDYLAKASIKEFSEQAKDHELGTERDKFGRRKMGESCSKDEHCKEDERCSKIGRCRSKNSVVSDACFYGFATCASEEGSPLRKRAEAEADRRLASTPSQGEQQLHHALLPGPAGNMMALPAPGDSGTSSSGSGNSSSSSSDNDGDKRQLLDLSSDSSSGGAISVAQKAQVAAIALVETVASGALAASGALPTDPEKWGKLATVGKERVTRRPFYNYWDKQDRTWRLATERLAYETKHNQTNETFKKINFKESKFPTLHDKAMLEWFEASGGKLHYVSHGVSATSKNQNQNQNQQRRLLADESIAEGDTILEVPLKLVMNQLTCHQVKTRRGRYLGELFGGAISGTYSDWGLAGFLLVELTKKEESKWWPFIRTLKMRVMTTDILLELEGTYTGKMLAQWESEAEDAQKYLDKVIDHKDPMGEIKGAWSLRKDMRWALWVVRRHAVWVYKPKTLKKILSLVPFAHVLQHRNKAGGTVLMGLDKVIRVQVGAMHAMGDVLGITYTAHHGSGKEGVSDMEQLIRFHDVDTYEEDVLMWEAMRDEQVLDGFRKEEDEEVKRSRNDERKTKKTKKKERKKLKKDGREEDDDEENDENEENEHEENEHENDEPDDEPEDFGETFSRNPFNRITVSLPGSKGIEVEDVFFEWTSMKTWRRAMKMPPKQSDLWRIANKLQLFGEEWDEDEQKAISGVNDAILKKLPFSVDMVPAEEQVRCSFFFFFLD